MNKGLLQTEIYNGYVQRPIADTAMNIVYLQRPIADTALYNGNVERPISAMYKGNKQKHFVDAAINNGKIYYGER